MKVKQRAEQRHSRGHAGGANQQKRLAAEAIDQQQGRDGADDVPDIEDDVDKNGLAGVGKPGVLEDGGHVLDENAGAAELLKGRQHAGDQHGEPHSRPYQFAPAPLVLVGRQDVFHLGLGVLTAVDQRQHVQGLAEPVFLGQPAGAFRHQQQPDDEQRHRGGVGGQHPLPLSVEGQGIGDDHRTGPAHHDRQLIDRHQSAADARRRHFGDEHRRDHGGQADPHPAEETKEAETDDAAGHRRADRARGEQQAGQDQGPLPAPTIAQGTANQRAGHATQQGAAHGQAHLMRIQAEGGLDEHHRPGNDRQIIAEEKPAHGRHHGQEVNQVRFAAVPQSRLVK